MERHITRIGLPLAEALFQTWTKWYPSIDPPPELTGTGCEQLYTRQCKPISGDLLAAKYKPGRLKASKAEVFLRSQQIEFSRKIPTHLVSSLPESGFPAVWIQRFWIPSSHASFEDHCHGHRLNPAIVKVVSRQFERVRVEQNHCQGLQTVKAS